MDHIILIPNYLLKDLQSVSQILKRAHEKFSESNRTMSSWSDVIDEEPAACVEDCPDDLGGILELLDATSDGSGSLRY